MRADDRLDEQGNLARMSSELSSLAPLRSALHWGRKFQECRFAPLLANFRAALRAEGSHAEGVPETSGNRLHRKIAP